jgi:heme/copper-type cytochrome/quinol oxidase subunit 4
MAPRRRSAWLRFFIGVAVFFGIVCAVVGIAVGLHIGLHATRIRCPDGTVIPVGKTEADVRCFVHRHAGDGTAIVVISAMLAILIVLCGVIGTVLVARRADADG